MLPNGAFILSEWAQSYQWVGESLLSIKTFPFGQAVYATDEARYLLDASSYLVLNAGRPYTITIEAAKPVESFCVFFAPGAAAEVWRSLITNAEALLDDPSDYLPDSIQFFERRYPHDTLVSPALAQLHRSLTALPTASPFENPPERGWVDEQLRLLLVRLLRAQGRVWDEAQALTAMRPATREEIYRRLYHARDYAHALLHQPLTIDDLARVAVMSPTHFLRVFRQAFHQTPHQYLITLRLARAQALLRETDRPVTDICYAVGFESPGSFSWRFHRRVGLSPAAYRNFTRARKQGDFGEAQGCR